MITGELIMIAGCVCLMHLTILTEPAKWVSFLIIAGVGMGLAQQLPYTAVQVALRCISMLLKALHLLIRDVI